MSNLFSAFYHGTWRMSFAPGRSGSTAAWLPNRACRRAASRFRRLTVAGALLGLAALLRLEQPAGALNGHWQPPDISPTQTPLADVLARIDAYRRNVDASYIEHLRIVVAGRTLTTIAAVRGSDVRYTTAIDGATYASGRFGEMRWRQNPAGLVHSLQGDLQGDPLDRWPVSILPIAAGDCTLVGETRGSRSEWVVQEARARDIVHWLYVDEASGAIDRELTREGSVVFTAAFDDERETLGARRPWHWTISGFGGTADVYADSIESRSADRVDVAMPAPRAPDARTTDVRPIVLPAAFTARGILVDVAVNGYSSRFVLDTGTTQILMTADAARRFGIATVLGHGIARRLDSGRLGLHDLPVMTVPDIFGLDGILGYDFFAGSIVHIDFAHARVEVMSRLPFTPPDDALDLPARFDEGIPLASATIGTIHGDRFALDTGSPEMLVPRYLWEQRDLDPRALGAQALAGVHPLTDKFLEGPIVTIASSLPDVQFGNVRFTAVTALVERTNAGPSIDIPFDAILGTDVLAHFEWWFDYTGGHAWIRAAP